MREWWTARPAVARMAIGIVFLAGLTSAPRLPILSDPEHVTPWIEVSLAVPGFSADAVDRWTAGRVEELVRSVRRVRSLVTVSRRERLTIRAAYDGSANIAAVRSMIAGRIQEYCEGEGRGQTADRISAGVQGDPFVLGGYLRIGVWKWESGEPPGPCVRRTILPALLAVRGVATVEVEGEERQAIVVTPRREAVIRHGLTSSRIASAFFDRFSTVGVPWRVPSGAPPVGGSLQEIVRHLPVAVNGSTADLSDCAVIRECSLPSDMVWRMDGRSAVVLTVRRKPETDLPGLAAQVHTALAACAPQLPPDTRWAILEDPLQNLRKDFGHSLLVAIASLLLMGLVAAVYARSWRASAVAIGIVTSLLSGALAALLVSGKAIDPSTTGGMVLGLVFVLPWIREEMLRASTTVPQQSFDSLVAGAASGAALIVFSKFCPPAEGREILADVGFGMAAVCASCFLALPIAAFPGAGSNGPRCPPAMIRAHHLITGWARQRKRAVLVGCALLLGLPLWLIPGKLPPDHPLFRLHLITFGSRPYAEFRPLVERLLGGIVYLAVSNGLRGEAGLERRNTVVLATLELPAGSSRDATGAATTFLERKALAIVGESARVTTTIGASTSTIRVEFTGSRADGPVPYRVSDGLKLAAGALGNTRVVVLGTGPGFQSGQPPLPTVVAELRGYDRQEMERVARGFQKFIESDRRIHEVDLFGSGGMAENQKEVHLVIDPRVSGGLAVSTISTLIRENAARSWVMETDGRSVLVRVAESIGDSARALARAGVARALNDLVTVRSEDAASVVLRDGREYVRWISCVFDGPEELAREVVSSFCTQYPLPPGYRIGLRGEFDPSGSDLLHLLGWGAVLATVAAAMAVAAVHNSWRAALAAIAALPCACIGISCAMVFVPTPAGVWAICALGVVMIASGIAGISTVSSPTGPEEVFGTWLLLMAGLGPFVLVPFLTEIRPVFHAGAFAAWSGIAGTISLLLTSMIVPVILGTPEELRVIDNAIPLPYIQSNKSETTP